MERFHLRASKNPSKRDSHAPLPPHLPSFPQEALMDPQYSSDMMETAKRWNFHPGRRTQECYSSHCNLGTGRVPWWEKGCEQKGNRGWDGGMQSFQMFAPYRWVVMACHAHLGDAASMVNIWTAVYQSSSLVPLSRFLTAEQVALCAVDQQGPKTVKTL